MPHVPEQKRETRERIIRTARRLFNRKGFAEVTIDEIMTEAGLTRGGFYRHFKTKDELYTEAVSQFLCKTEPEEWQRKHVDLCTDGATLARMIMDAYLSKDHLDDRDGSCPTAALPSDVSRSGAPVKKAFRMVVEMMHKVFGAALPGPDASERALALVSLCVGAMVVARAVDDPELADALRIAARKHMMASTGWT